MSESERVVQKDVEVLPHRHRVAVGSRIVIGVLLAYLILMHSYWWEDRHGGELRDREQWQVAMQQRINDRAVRDAAAVEATLQQFVAGIADERRRLAEAVARAQEVVWVTLTPEAERAIELRKAVQQMQQEMTDHIDMLKRAMLREQLRDPP
mgnify:FL=1